MMKKLSTLLFSLLVGIMALAQEVPQEEYEYQGWSDTTKWSVLGVFTVIIIVLVLRTFRNKPTI